jgi:hypothetical protein
MAMNWVKQEHHRETHLDANADSLVEALFLALKESVDEFNRLYRQGKTQVDQQPNKHHLFLSLTLPVPSTPGTHRQRAATARISYDAAAYKVSATFEHSKARPVALEIDIDNDERLFLRAVENTSPLDTDGASRLLLKAFLWELRAV